MPTTRPEPQARSRAVLLLAAVLMVGPLLAGCSGDPPADETPDGVAAEVLPLMKKLLRQRGHALVQADEQAFMATVDPSAPRFVEREQVYFANMAQLPVRRLAYRVEADSLVRAAGGFDVVVQVHLQLGGFDAVPVVRPALFHFTHDPASGTVLVAGDRDRSWEQRTGVEVQPWDDQAITVVQRGGVLGIFDRQSALQADQVMRAVEDGIDEVADVVPYDWDAHVVAYALSDTDLLEGLDDLPAEDPDALDAVSFPVPSRLDRDAPLAGTRFLLHPRMLASEADQLARLIRHELTHVALGSRDDEVPTWLGEGIAEWVSVQPLPADERLISQSAIDAADAGLDELPADVDYNDADQAAHYGISWWACETIVEMYGEERLWQLLDDLAQTSPERQDDQLQQTLQMGSAQLAREAARRIVATYE
ncbi:hypothetical protein [Nocardioides currus]|uniref:Peptidase MA-like domain-containing protein n=1 Tax=Nocardioides currus TaxID=2133958 RepID=A0A2R7YU75_9ACTN|nr:hypothetical protein [Nocardioides currus]PUA79636.1 hypothetical protein C7S10_18125 [Nocardioides currus]